MVPDARTAIRVASAILETYMGAGQFSKAVQATPLRASLDGEVWTVYFYPTDAGRETTNKDGSTSVVVVAGGGGNPEIQIAKTDARVIGLFYSR
jgi:regulator of RNase E activity RraA